MNWTLFDFLLVFALVAGVALAVTLVMRASTDMGYRRAAGFALVGGVALFMVTGAVGIIGSAENDANMAYYGLLALGLAGAALSRLRAHGMMLTLAAMAVGQVAIGAVALAGGLGAGAEAWPKDVIGATMGFTAIWILAAAGFRAAARRELAA